MYMERSCKKRGIEFHLDLYIEHAFQCTRLLYLAFVIGDEWKSH